MEWIENKEKEVPAPRLHTDKAPCIKSMVGAMAKFGEGLQKKKREKPIGPLREQKGVGSLSNRKESEDEEQDENVDGGSVPLEELLRARTDDTSKFLAQCLSCYHESARLSLIAVPAPAPKKAALKRKRPAG
jgi:hypothetical protein